MTFIFNKFKILGEFEMNILELYSDAQQGDVVAQFSLGWCYKYGEGVKKDYVQAVNWYRKAAEQEYAEAQFFLGLCYESGEGVEKDLVEAVKWFRKAAKQENAEAQLFLGFCYEYGKGVEKDFVEAVKWFRKAAKQGNACAPFSLGLCYKYGKGVEKDYVEAVKWFSKAAEQGNADAQYNLGVCYDNGIGVEKDLAEAVKWWGKAAEQGNADAQYNLGVCYEYGKGVMKDLAEAVKWYREAAEQGNADAQYNLGVCYYCGNGVKKDYVKAVNWYRKAAEQEYAKGQNNLGVCYDNGIGVEKDLAEAVKWWGKAAEQGNADAQYNLGVCYEYGKGVMKDLAEAVKWYREAAEQGNADAQTAINKLENSADNSDEKNCNNCLVVTTGSLPYQEDDFDDLLRTKVKDVCTPSENIDIIIIGREFNQTILDEQINLRIGQSLFVYSQEMFLSRLAGKDPYDDKDALMKFAEGHPVFKYLNDCFIEWPTTHIVQSLVGLAVDDDEWVQEGVLDDNGYHVGNSGKERDERRRILAKVFTTKLNNVTSLEYMAEWGSPNTGSRLQKLANTIASLARNAKRRNNPPEQAIEDWENDLEWLKNTYYSGRFNFDWPRAVVR